MGFSFIIHVSLLGILVLISKRYDLSCVDFCTFSLGTGCSHCQLFVLVILETMFIVGFSRCTIVWYIFIIMITRHSTTTTNKKQETTNNNKNNKQQQTTTNNNNTSRSSSNSSNNNTTSSSISSIRSNNNNNICDVCTWIHVEPFTKRLPILVASQVICKVYYTAACELRVKSYYISHHGFLSQDMTQTS